MKDDKHYGPVYLNFKKIKKNVFYTSDLLRSGYIYLLKKIILSKNSLKIHIIKLQNYLF